MEISKVDQYYIQADVQGKDYIHGVLRMRVKHVALKKTNSINIRFYSQGRNARGIKITTSPTSSKLKLCLAPAIEPGGEVFLTIGQALDYWVRLLSHHRFVHTSWRSGYYNKQFLQGTSAAWGLTQWRNRPLFLGFIDLATRKVSSAWLGAPYSSYPRTEGPYKPIALEEVYKTLQKNITPPFSVEAVNILRADIKKNLEVLDRLHKTCEAIQDMVNKRIQYL